MTEQIQSGKRPKIVRTETIHIHTIRSPKLERDYWFELWGPCPPGYMRTRRKFYRGCGYLKIIHTFVKESRPE